jgi:cytochrome c5
MFNRRTTVTTSNSSNSSTFVGLVAGVLISAVLLFLLAITLGGDGPDEDMGGTDAQQGDSVALRTQPVVTLADLMAEPKPVAEPEPVQEPAAADEPAPAADAATADEPTPVADARPASDLYNGACAACHNLGVAGAPKFGDRAAWEPRYANGIDALLETAITGKGAMPPNGASTYSKADLRRTIEYMLSEAGF